MDIKIVDALPGAGKTMSCINMINKSSTDEKYIFVTPYLDEVKRVKSACKQKNFKAPKYEEGKTKSDDLYRLVCDGENIVTTHALFMNISEETEHAIAERNYTLVYDETVEMFKECYLAKSDAQMLLDLKALQKNPLQPNHYLWNYPNYKCGVFDDIAKAAMSGKLVSPDGKTFFQIFSLDFLNCFKKVYILTHMFEHSIMRCCMDIDGFEYEYTGCRQVDGEYQLCKKEEINHAVDLRKKINIVKTDKRLISGYEKTALSSSWFDGQIKTKGAAIKKLKNNLRNVFRNDMVCAGGDKKMWTTFKKAKGALSGKGYTKDFIPFNMRATNDFSDRTKLAFCLNVFMVPSTLRYLNSRTKNKLSQDMYALSSLIQWLFRSNLRKGGDVWVYIPSARMRLLLEKWLDNLSNGKGYDIIEIPKREYKTLGLNGFSISRYLEVQSTKTASDCENESEDDESEQEYEELEDDGLESFLG